MENFDALDENRSTRNAAGLTAAVTALTWAFLPLANWAGVASFSLGERSFSGRAGTHLLALAAISLFGTFFLLVFPTVHWLYSEGSELFQGPARVIAVSTLLFLPVISFAHYLGHFKVSIDYIETTLFLFVPIFTQVLLFEKERSPLVLTLGLFVGLFPPIFVVNDLMGPFPTLFNYAPIDMTAYYMHRGLSFVAVAYACVRCVSVFRTPSRVPLVVNDND